MTLSVGCYGAHWGRSTITLLFSPVSGTALKTLHEVCREVIPWLQMAHSLAPGSYFFLVCSRAESPPAGVSLEEWRQRVKKLAGSVEKEVWWSVYGVNRV